MLMSLSSLIYSPFCLKKGYKKSYQAALARFVVHPSDGDHTQRYKGIPI